MAPYRTARGPRQRVVAYLGQLDARGRLEVQLAPKGQQSWQQRLEALVAHILVCFLGCVLWKTLEQ